jgi:hypothetical protein
MCLQECRQLLLLTAASCALLLDLVAQAVLLLQLVPMDPQALVYLTVRVVMVCDDCSYSNATAAGVYMQQRRLARAGRYISIHS